MVVELNEQQALLEVLLLVLVVAVAVSMMHQLGTMRTLKKIRKKRIELAHLQLAEVANRK